MESNNSQPTKQRIKLLKIPIDIVNPEDLEQVILSILEQDGPKQIIILSIWDFLRARRNSEYRTMVQNASLVLPTSKSLIRGAWFLNKQKLIRYNPFNLIIQILGILERYHKSVYFFGARKKSLLIAESNVKKTFPDLHCVGRFMGYYHKSMERNIITAIQKSTPSLVLVSDGVPGKERWIYRNRRQFSKSIFLWAKSVLDIFAERRSRDSDSLFEKGLEVIPFVCKNPLRIFYFFRYIWYNLTLLVYKIFNL